MPIYDYQCKSCEATTQVVHKIADTPPSLECECGGEVRKVILTAPGVVVPPQHRGTGSKLSYYGIKNPVTGQGIEKLKPGWADSGAPGIRVRGTGPSTDPSKT